MKFTDGAGERMPLSAAQQDVWIAQELEPTNPQYNCGGYLELQGSLDLACFERAVAIASAECQALRLRFVEQDGEIRQVADAAADARYQLIDLATDIDPEAAAVTWMWSNLGTAVDLRTGPLFDQVLFKLSSDHYYFYFRYHHIAIDGFGQSVYWRRLAQIYSTRLSRDEPGASPFSPLAILLDQAQAYQDSARYPRDREYWLGALADAPAATRLANGSAAPAAGFLRRCMALEPQLVEQLRAHARLAASRWSVVVIGAVAAYLYRLTGNQDIVLTLPVAGRSNQAAMATPFMMANELPLRLRFHAEISLAELWRQVADQIGLLLKHQGYRGETLQRELRATGATAGDGQLGGPVVNVIAIEHGLRFGDVVSKAHHLSSGPVKDVLIGFYGKPDGSESTLYFDANPGLYTAEDIAVHQRRFVLWLERLVNAGLDTEIGAIDILQAGERERIDAVFNATDRPYDLSRCLHHWLEARALATPDAVAVATAERTLDFRQLMAAADKLAWHLLAQGVTPGQYVGVCDWRSPELVIALLAVLKAGAAYVPLDPELPSARLNFQLQDAGVGLVLTSSGLRQTLAELEVTTLEVDSLLPGLPEAAEPPRPELTPEHPAYLIYTSGSTGRPKGVSVPHRGIVNRLLWMQEEYALGADDCVLQKTPFTFDVSVWEFFWPLMVGCRLFLAAPGAHRDPRYVARTIREQGVTTLHFVPPMLDLFLAEPEAAELPGLRQVMCSGEALRPETVAAFFRRYDAATAGIELHNLYGPTEASVDVTYWRCRPEHATAPIPIGRPVANTRIHLLDQRGQPVPIGVSGELYIAGVQVALGYLNRPELNRERFIAGPTDGTWYRTGDLARYREDGAIEFLGRMDQQVKIRGYRIELGEIESALLGYPGVEHAVVTTWQAEAGDRRLAAYVVMAVGETLDTVALAAALAERLPEYMVPAQITVLDVLPLLPNGKVDRRALPVPVASVADNGAVAEQPRNELEHLLHAAWREVLGLTELGIRDSFFALGGDSMHSIKLRALLERQGYSFDIQDLFGFPSIAELAPRLSTADAAPPMPGTSAPFAMITAADQAALPGGLVDAYPLSAMQGGMLFQAEFDADSSVYRVVTSLQVAARYRLEALRLAIAETFQRHPALRSSFDLSTFSEPLQLVHERVRVPLHEGEDLSALEAAEQEARIRAWVERHKFHRFDPSAPPLVFFCVHRRGAECFQLSVVEHHVVLDGWSDVLMLQEILARYRAHLADEELRLADVASRYRDFVALEREVSADAGMAEFWQRRLHDFEPAPLPKRKAEGATVTATAHRSYPVELPSALAAGLRQLARREALPLKSLLIAAHLAVLRLVCASDSVSAGMVFNGRLQEQGGDQVIGVFLNTLPLHMDTREVSLLALARQVFDYEKAVTPYGRYPLVRMQQDLAGQLALDNYVNFMDFHVEWHEDGAREVLIRDAFGVAETNFPLAVNFLVDPVHGGLGLWLDCDLAWLAPAFCERLGGYYRRALDAIHTTPEAKVADLDLLAAAERRQLALWNDTAAAYNPADTIPGLIRHQAGLRPEAVALAYRWETISYAELERRSNRIAHHLLAQGVQRGDRVGVSMGRSADLVIALLGVMKTGAAYVPLDPDYPSDRLSFIARDAALRCLLVDGSGPRTLPVAKLVDISADAAAIGRQSAAPVAVTAGGNDVAYVIYTSGSTGRPKGTVIRHLNVVNFFLGMDRCIGCGGEDVVLGLTSVSFDISVLELFWPLSRGAKVVVAGEHMINHLAGRHEHESQEAEHGFSALCRRHGLSIVQATPSFFTAVTAEPEALAALAGTRAVLVGGEPFPVGLAERLVAGLPRTRLFNMYGPTETTIWSTVHELQPQRDIADGVIPIGRPIANTELLVLDTQGRLAPIGVEGELWIAGDGVSGSYLGRPELTAERFPSHPWGAGLVYRTGDRVRWREDGVLEFLGRVDRQVKILGHRIEPDEVESVLSRHPRLSSVAVVAAENAAGGVELIAYLATADEAVRREAEAAHVDYWGQVWESAYSGGETAENPFSGWASSYTGAAIPEDQMQEWLAHTVARITELKPVRIIEIGVGVGLLLRKLAPTVEHYLGLDVSATALQRAAGALEAEYLHRGRVELRAGDAMELLQLPPMAGATLVLNSVIQYFPSLDYLEQVLSAALRLVGDTGTVFIGDVRSLELLPAFHAEVQLYRAQSFTTVAELARTAKRQLAAERELCVSTAFFRDLVRKHGHGHGLRIELKRNPSANEMTHFRYDVTLLGPALAQPAPADSEWPWSRLRDAADALQALDDQLAGLADEETLVVTGVVNRRLLRAGHLLSLLAATDEVSTAWDVERELWALDAAAGLDPHAVMQLAERHGREVRLLVTGSQPMWQFDAEFSACRAAAGAWAPTPDAELHPTAAEAAEYLL
ncbi:amino acid adenylation domain-containing protein [Endothiovibrio diazotrophicus]